VKETYCISPQNWNLNKTIPWSWPFKMGRWNDCLCWSNNRTRR